MRQRIVALVSRPDFWLVCLLIWLLGSAGRSLGTPWIRVAATEALRWCAGIGLMLALGCCRRGSEPIAKFMVLLAGALTLLGIADGVRPDQGGMVGPYHDHQLYGSVLLMLLPLAAALALTARENGWRLGGLAVLAAGTLCLLFSQTRSAWAGLLTAAIVFGWLWFRHTRLPIRYGRTIAVTAVVLLVGIAAVWMLIGTASLRGSMTVRAASVTSLRSDESWQARLTAWRGAGHLIEAHVFNGIGLGRYPDSQRAWTHVGRSLGTTTRPSLSEEAHSFYLQTAAETGLIGLSLYLAVLAAYAVQSVHRLSKSRRTSPTGGEALIIAALSALAGQAVDALANPSWQFAEVSLFFWATLGLGRMALRQEGTRSVPVPLSQRKWHLSPRIAVGVAFVALAAEIVPVGLLTPVEAYTPAQIKPGSVALQASAATTLLGVPVTYQLTAKDTNGNPINLTFDGSTIFTASSASRPDGAYTKYLSKDTAHGVMVFLIPLGVPISNGVAVKIQATYPSYLSTYSQPLQVNTN